MKVTKKFIKILLIIVATIIVLGLVLEFAVLRTSAWTKLPAYWRTQVAFIKLEEVANDASCRESCVFERAGLENLIVDYMVKNPGVFDEQIERYIKDDKVSLDFKTSLLNMAFKAEREREKTDTNYEMKIPGYLLKYLEEEETDPNVRATILLRFYPQLGGSDWLIDDLLNIIKDKDKSVDKRIAAIMDLSNMITATEESGDERRGRDGFLTPKYKNINYPDLAEIFLGIAEDENLDIYLRNEALDAVSATFIFKDIYTEDLFNRIEIIFNNRDNHLGIRDTAVDTMQIYGLIDKERTNQTMEKIYNDKTEHIYLVYDAWSFLNENGYDNYLEPSITESEYDDYFTEALLRYTRKSYLE